jgi:hypothetical protein
MVGPMPIRPTTSDELHRAARGDPGHDLLWEPQVVLVVDLDAPAAGPAAATPLGTGVAAVIVGTSDEPGAALRDGRAADCDLVVRPEGLPAVVATVERAPIASTAFALLLRGCEGRSVDEGLHVESAVYSALQAGPEFASWRAGRAVRSRPDPAEVVRLDRHGATLTITLARPEVRNALNTALRDQLLSGLALAEADSTITEVHLRGAGPAFSSGGDLDEFGSFADPATAHLVRLSTSIGRAIDRIRDRVTVHVHGPCAGSGVELPAFAGRVVAAAGTTFALPEVSLGLVPGAGGTLSLPRRIGRHRTAELGLGGRAIDAATALEWGLVDAFEEA